MRSQLLMMLVISLSLGCGELESLDSADQGANCGPEGCFNTEVTPVDGGVSDVAAEIGNDAPTKQEPLANPLCGYLTCDPDDTEATKCNGSGGLDASLVPDIDESGDAGEEQDAEDAQAGSMGGGKKPNSPPPKPDEPPVALSACHVTKDIQGERVTSCVPGGIGVDNDPCLTSSDCAAGYACVGDVDVGVCRGYCCLDAEACPQGTYCGVLPSRAELLKDPEDVFLLPVCIPSNDCELLSGPEGTNRCPEGQACAIVRSDGATACQQPGTAVQGESCGPESSTQSPCAEGYVCSKATNTCLALCRVNSSDSCGKGVCQGGNNGIPEEYGVCVGAQD